MSFRNQLKYMAIGAVIILFIAYMSYTFYCEVACFICLLIAFICSEIESKKK